MAFEGNFSFSQPSESEITFNDTSTGDATGITGRRISVIKYNQDTRVPSDNPTGQTYIDWDIDDTSITVDVLDRDYAVFLTVEWLIAVPDPSGVYTKTYAYCFTEYTETFLDGLISTDNVGYPRITNSKLYMDSWTKLRLWVDSAFDIVDQDSDIMNAQLMLDKCYEIMNNESAYFT